MDRACQERSTPLYRRLHARTRELCTAPRCTCPIRPALSLPPIASSLVPLPHSCLVAVALVYTHCSKCLLRNRQCPQRTAAHVWLQTCLRVQWCALLPATPRYRICAGSPAPCALYPVSSLPDLSPVLYSWTSHASSARVACLPCRMLMQLLASSRRQRWALLRRQR